MHSKRRQVACVCYNSLIYVIGGYDHVSYLTDSNTVERYSEEDHCWSWVSSMHTKRHGHAAVIADGHIYAMGGSDKECGNETPLMSMEKYDLTSDEWALVAPMQSPRIGLASVAIQDRIFALGGYEEGSEVYSIDSDCWASIPAESTKRSCPGAVVVNDSILLLGGLQLQGQARMALTDTVEQYHPHRNAWVGAPSMPVARSCFAVVALHDVVYVIGGQDKAYRTLGTVIALDMRVGKWSLTDVPLPAMRTARSSHGAVLLNNFIYVVGGCAKGVGCLSTAECLCWEMK